MIRRRRVSNLVIPLVDRLIALGEQRGAHPSVTIGGLGEHEGRNKRPAVNHKSCIN